ncbi:MAG TPA: FAD-dependent oxidoreductase [Pelagibacterium sp.]|uniref:FAD-dependent oxidoreductase n=1 Tax=Pelagibacterium sp. TaxID=1967288 RepID=UPI002CAE7033|nr:FAD-dependent oxidoreductase [Pelagibacterium sp.]HWJ87147.1 FAD-dependent oxidoreductase [Pelagibacterium sp.]
MGAPRTIAIAGAGIAGLTLALALAKFGVRVVVLERNPTISEVGAGLQISPNARKSLDRLGLSQAIAQKSFVPEGIDVFPDGRTSPLQTLTLGDAIATRFGAPYAVMHRADLVDILYASARRFANIDIVFSVPEFTVRPEGSGVSVELAEPDGKTRRMRAFAFVGADGVRSITRTHVLGGPQAQYSGKVAWRALVAPDAVDGAINLARTTLLLNPRFHLVVYPLPHRNAVNLALFTQESKNNLAVLDQRAPRIRAGNNHRVTQLLAAVGESWTPWVLSSVHTSPWHHGPIGLVGDAAHAMLPFQAQGAAMAIEDAAVLAPLLAAAPDANHAFTRFTALRLQRVTRVQTVSRQNGKIFHMGFPLATARNAVMRLQGPRGHFRRLDWLYGYDPAASP